jgi:hypothetical protein
MELRNEKGNIFWSTECEDPIAAIKFVLEGSDNLEVFDKMVFLRDWFEGDISQFPEFLQFLHEKKNS